MDYEKKYKEALERARQFSEHPLQEDSSNIVEYIFPELKESEDEKIRKVIIGLLKQSTYEDCDYDGVNMKDIYAWLEKQGEPTDINPSEFDLHLNKLLKQFETLPKEELVSSLGFYLNVVQNDGTYKPDEKQGEQKPVWSEEDETKMHAALAFIKSEFPKEGNEEFMEDTIEWLKSLRPQPKHEWSEEDESRMDNLCHFLEEYGNQYYGYLTLQGTISWLKSLKPQKQWRPSKGQLECLGYAIDKAEKDYSPLANNRIYLTLKALKKELEKLTE